MIILLCIYQSLAVSPPLMASSRNFIAERASVITTSVSVSSGSGLRTTNTQITFVNVPDSVPQVLIGMNQARISVGSVQTFALTSQNTTVTGFDVEVKVWTQTDVNLLKICFVMTTIAQVTIGILQKNSSTSGFGNLMSQHQYDGQSTFEVALPSKSNTYKGYATQIGYQMTYNRNNGRGFTILPGFTNSKISFTLKRSQYTNVSYFKINYLAFIQSEMQSINKKVFAGTHQSLYFYYNPFSKQQVWNVSNVAEVFNQKAFAYGFSGFMKSINKDLYFIIINQYLTTTDWYAVKLEDKISPNKHTFFWGYTIMLQFGCDGYTTDIYLALNRSKCIDKCPNGQYANNNNQCTLCGDLCQTCQNDKDHCLSCKSSQNRAIDINTCQCSQQHYQNGTNICPQCHYSCYTCTNSSYNQCLSCQSNRILTTTSCPCIPGYYQNNNICKICHYSCKQCNNLQNNCTNCQINHFRQIDNNKCDCKQGYFDQGVGLCGSCDGNCKQCEVISTNCTQCHPISNIVLISGKCECANGFFQNNSICQSCDITCKTCSSQTLCTSCEILDKRILDNQNCICQTGFYNVPNIKQCQQCDETCYSCSGPNANQCQACQSNFYRQLVVNLCNCISGYYHYGSPNCLQCSQKCLECSSPLDCTACNTTNNRKLVSSRCICQDGQYQDNNLCKPCHYSCLYCSGKNKNKCTSCDIASNRQLDNTFCNCKQGYFDDGVSICPLCHYSCLQCTSSSKCSTCNSTLFRIYNSTTFSCDCLTSFYHISTPTCFPCNILCLTCDGPTNSDCLSCYSDRELIGQICQCKSGKVSKNSQCVQCNKKCKSCTGQSQAQCSQCQITHYRILNDSKCICITGYYDLPNTAICDTCHYSCQGCTGFSQFDCTSCNANYHRYFNTTNCPCIDGYYNNYNVLCQKCHYSCLTCTKGDKQKCILCDLNLKRQIQPSYQCQCQKGYYNHNAEQKCKSCHYTCQSCKGGQDNKCLSCNGTRILVDNYCNCPVGVYNSISKQNCQSCQFPCIQCINSQTQCTNCNQSLRRQLNNKNCTCMNGYYQVGSICQNCNYQCSKCQVNQDNCTQCDQIVKFRELVGNSCPCRKGFYQSISLCQPCPNICQQCIAFDTCTSCPFLQHRQLINYQCVCKEGFFQHGIICQQCNKQCKSCIGKWNDQCNGCFDGMLLHNGKCKCIQGFNQQGVCQICHYSCLTCNNQLQTQCITCRNPFVLTTIPPQVLCLCPLRNYPVNNSCTQCNPTCYQCHTYIQCKSCLSIQFRQLIGTNCSCIDGYYDNGNQRCQLCSRTCRRCNNIQCLECKIGLYRQIYHGSCVCSLGYLEKGYLMCEVCSIKCLACQITADRCVTCNGTLNRVFQNNTCVCKQRYYESIPCRSCHSTCYRCYSRPLQTDCTECYFQDHRQLFINTCICQNGYYQNESNACVLCHPYCSSCYGQTNYNCNNCSVGYQIIGIGCQKKRTCTSGVYYQTSCLQSCPVKYVQHDGYCVGCSQQCIQCNRTNCLICKQPLFALNINCVNTCPIGYYSNQSICIKCHQTCISCTFYHKQMCLECQSNLYLYKQYCVQQCPKSYFTYAQYCLQCPPLCLQCYSHDNCTSCIQDYQSSNGKCEKCKQQTYWLDGNCYNCQEGCIKCNKLQCFICQEQKYLSNNKCINKNQFYDITTEQIKKCKAPCEQCRSREVCLKCPFPSLFDYNCSCNSSKVYQSKTNQCISNTFMQLSKKVLPSVQLIVGAFNIINLVGLIGYWQQISWIQTEYSMGLQSNLQYLQLYSPRNWPSPIKHQNRMYGSRLLELQDINKQILQKSSTSFCFYFLLINGFVWFLIGVFKWLSNRFATQNGCLYNEHYFIMCDKALKYLFLGVAYFTLLFFIPDYIFLLFQTFSNPTNLGLMIIITIYSVIFIAFLIYCIYKGNQNVQFMNYYIEDRKIGKGIFVVLFIRKVGMMGLGYVGVIGMGIGSLLYIILFVIISPFKRNYNIFLITNQILQFLYLLLLYLLSILQHKQQLSISLISLLYIQTIFNLIFISYILTNCNCQQNIIVNIDYEDNIDRQYKYKQEKIQDQVEISLDAHWEQSKNKTDFN